MKNDGTGRPIQIGDVLYYQPWTYSSAGTPHTLRVLGTVNQQPLCDQILVIHVHDQDNPNGMATCHDHSELWPTPQLAKLQAAVHALRRGLHLLNELGRHPDLVGMRGHLKISLGHLPDVLKHLTRKV